MKLNKCLVIATVSDGGYYNDIEPSSFDLALINFNEDKYIECKGKFKYFVHSNGFKHHLIYDFILNNNILDVYDWIWMPDYDVHLDLKEIEFLFSIAECYNLNICQPSLTHDSYHSFPIVLCDDRFNIRYTNFVEVMCPLFKSDTLKKVLWTFKTTYSGWGQDFLWAKELSYEKLAIVDLIKAKHIKPIESQHWKLPHGMNAEEEMHMLLKLHGLNLNECLPNIIGFINKT